MDIESLDYNVIQILNRSCILGVVVGDRLSSGDVPTISKAKHHGDQHVSSRWGSAAPRTHYCNALTHILLLHPYPNAKAYTTLASS